MKFTLSWLKKHLDFNNSISELNDALIRAGMEVEAVENYVDKLQPFSLAYIKEASKHPNADKLNVCIVDTIDGEMQIVCGAPNARAGIYVIYAPSNSYIPGLDVVLKPASIRGVQSNGMMLSERELGISDEHDSIIEITPQPNEAYKVGDNAATVLGLDDIVFDISITPNRGDLLGVRGIAKDLAAIGFGTLKALAPTNFNYSSKVQRITMDIDSNVSKKFHLRRIDNLKNPQSPKWLQQQLRFIGLTPRSALVDIANYCMFDLNQPFHCYDRNKLITNNDETYHLEVKLGSKDTFAGLNQKEYPLNERSPLVIINGKIEALGGVMGGLSSSCDDDTTSILLEAAHFDNKVITFAKRDLSINTDAAYRYEREMDIANINESLNVLTALILEICGGDLIEETVFATPITTTTLNITTHYINQLSGLSLNDKDVEQTLSQLNCSFNKKDSVFEVTPPSYRNDMNCESVIIEDIIRVYGVNNLPPFDLDTLPRNDTVAYDETFNRILTAKKSLASIGMLETINMSFISKEMATIFDIFDENLVLHNPISEELSIMRQSLIPSLILTANKNIKNSYSNLKLFEVGKIYTNNGEENVASGIFCGNCHNKDWQGNNINYNVWDSKKTVMTLLKHLSFDGDNLNIENNNLPSFYHGGKSAALMLGKNIVGYIGEIHPLILKKLNIKMPMFVFEIFLDKIPFAKNKNSMKSQLIISDLMPIKRDFSFVVAKTVKSSEIIRLVKSIDKKTITHVDIFDIYEDASLGAENKSISISVTLQAYDNTFVDTEINKYCEDIIAIIAKKLQGQLRQ